MFLRGCLAPEASHRFETAKTRNGYAARMARSVLQCSFGVSMGREGIGENL